MKRTSITFMNASQQARGSSSTQRFRRKFSELPPVVRREPPQVGKSPLGSDSSDRFGARCGCEEKVSDSLQAYLLEIEHRRDVAVFLEACKECAEAYANLHRDLCGGKRLIGVAFDESLCTPDEGWCNRGGWLQQMIAVAMGLRQQERPHDHAFDLSPCNRRGQQHRPAIELRQEIGHQSLPTGAARLGQVHTYSELDRMIEWVPQLLRAKSREQLAIDANHDLIAISTAAHLQVQSGRYHARQQRCRANSIASARHLGRALEGHHNQHEFFCAPDIDIDFGSVAETIDGDGTKWRAGHERVEKGTLAADLKFVRRKNPSHPIAGFVQVSRRKDSICAKRIDICASTQDRM
ncbi:hypothetical protein FQZ97_866060 [compost metagenome]